MRVLGVDPSLTNYGWAIHDTSMPVGDPRRCESRGRFQTSAKQEFITRYMLQRQRLVELVEELRPDAVGVEFPVFGNLWSEGMYGLFLFTCEALRQTRCDVVFWTPLQLKAHARELVNRPKGWKMDKKDMVEAVKVDAGPGRWNHNEADAYHCARLSARFWEFYAGTLPQADLSPVERKFFTEVKVFQRGKKAGKMVKRGTIYREDDRFFLWSNLDS
jgi:Holliday junction resolvasome RuvABC endonuclease subunit